MATPNLGYAPHSLFTFGGSIGTAPNADKWQCGVRLRIAQATPHVTDVDGSLTNPAGYLAAVAPNLKTWFTRVPSSSAGSEFSGLRADATLEWAKCNNIGANGRYSDLAHANTWSYSTPFGMGTVGATAPPFVTLAVSLLTNNQRGPGHRGRIYLPVALPSTPSGKLSPPYPLQVGGVVKQLLTLLRAQADGGTPGGVAVEPCIASKKDKSLSLITGITTGDVIDVQRRRKEQIPEAYTPYPYP